MASSDTKGHSSVSSLASTMKTKREALIVHPPLPHSGLLPMASKVIIEPSPLGPVPVRVGTNAVDSKWRYEHRIGSHDSLSKRFFFDTDWPAPPQSLMSGRPPPTITISPGVTVHIRESIRVAYAEDEALRSFIDSVRMSWPSGPSDRERILYCMRAVITAFGGPTSATDIGFDEKCVLDMNALQQRTGLPFVMLGDAIGYHGDCRPRCLLFKLIADLSCENPKEWGDRPLRGVEMRRGFFRRAHNGLCSHSFIVIVSQERKEPTNTKDIPATGLQESTFNVDPVVVVDPEYTPDAPIVQPQANPPPSAQRIESKGCVPPPEVARFIYSYEKIVDVSPYEEAMLPLPIAVMAPKALPTIPMRPSSEPRRTFDQLLIPYGISKDNAMRKVILESVAASADAASLTTTVPRANTLAVSKALVPSKAKLCDRKIVQASNTPIHPITCNNMEKLSADFKTSGVLSADHITDDGFRVMLGPGEDFIFDARTDPELAQTVVSARNLLRMYVGGEKRAIVLAKFVAIKLNQLPDGSNVKSKLASAITPFGHLIRRCATAHYRALLFKYIADCTVRNPAIFSSSRARPEVLRASVTLSLQSPSQTNVTAFLENEKFLIDFVTTQPKFTPYPLIDLPQEIKIAPITSTLRVNWDSLQSFFVEGVPTPSQWNGRDAALYCSPMHAPIDGNRFIADMEALGSARHPHMCALYALYQNIPGKVMSSVTREIPAVAVLFEHHAGETLSNILNSGNTKIVYRLQLGVELAMALSHLHSLGIAFGRALSPDAIHIDGKTGYLKLDPIDLHRYVLAVAGMKYSPAKPVAQGKDTIEAAFQYWPPERFSDECVLTSAADVYTFGAILHALLSNCEPWSGRSFNEVRATVMGGNRPAHERERTAHTPNELLRLALLCMAQQPHERPTIDEVLERLRTVTEAVKHAGVDESTRPDLDATARAATRAVIAVSTRPEEHDSKYEPIENLVPVEARAGASALPITTGVTDPRTEAKFAAIEASLQPLNAQFGDGPSVEACDAAREQFYEQLGVIDKKMLVGEHVATCALYIIHRPGGNVALASRGLSDPPSESPNTTGFGLELWGEAKEADVGTGAQLGSSYLFQMMHEVAGNVRQFGLKLRTLIDIHGLVSMELNNVDAPPLYVDPQTNRACVLLGITTDGLPDHFQMPGGLKVRLITVRLLTHEECLVVRRFGSPGRRAIAELFTRNMTHHVSSARAPIGLTPITITIQAADGKTIFIPSIREAPVGLGYGGLTTTGSSPLDAKQRESRVERMARGLYPGYGYGYGYDSDPQEKEPVIILNAGFPFGNPAAAAAAQGSQPGAGAIIPGGGADRVPALPVQGPGTGPGGRALIPPRSETWHLDTLKRRLLDLMANVQAQSMGGSSAAGAITGAMEATAAMALGPNAVPAQFVGVLGPTLNSALPALDSRFFEPAITPHAIFPKFQPPSAFANAMASFDARVKIIAATAGHPAQPYAKHVVITLATQTQLAGWLHVQEYIVDPKAYADKLRALRGEATTPQALRGHPVRAIDHLQVTGRILLTQLMHRVDWVLDLLARNKLAFDPDFCLHVVAADIKWMDDSMAFMKEAEIKVTELLRRNPQRFAAFRDLQKRGVQWPHSPQLRKDIETANYVFRPMMVKRDRCVCETCGVEIAGWRPWHNPWQMHNLARHPKDFLNIVLAAHEQYAQIDTFTYFYSDIDTKAIPSSGPAGTTVSAKIEEKTLREGKSIPASSSTIQGGNNPPLSAVVAQNPKSSPPVAAGPAAAGPAIAHNPKPSSGPTTISAQQTANPPESHPRSS